MNRDYSLVRPCPKCPFRTDVSPYLTPERVAEIATDVQSGANFYCHQTTEYQEDEDGAGDMAIVDTSMVCAGSMILMEKAGSPNQMLRIAERIGFYDPSRLDMDAPVHGSWIEMQRHFEPEEVETCEIVNSGCEAPAGYAIGGGVVSGTVAADYSCGWCGRAVCGNCSAEVDGEQVCDDCREEDGMF
jgi:hypothetical protein